MVRGYGIPLSAYCLIYILLAGLLTSCGNPIAAALATATSTATPTATLTATATATPSPTATFTPTPTSTPTLTPTATPSPTNTATPTATSSPTATLSPTPADTPTPTPVPPTPTPTETPKPVVDFRIASWRLWPLALNSGCAKGMHVIFIHVLDVNGQPLDGVVLGDTWNNVEVTSGNKGPGRTEIDLWTNTMAHSQPTNPYHSVLPSCWPNTTYIAHAWGSNNRNFEI